jgi:hypothetical protein
MEADNTIFYVLNSAHHQCIQCLQNSGHLKRILDRNSNFQALRNYTGVKVNNVHFIGAFGKRSYKLNN